MFPKDEPSLLFALRHDQLLALCHMITSTRMIHNFNPQRLDLLIEVKEGLNWRDMLDKLPWCPSVVSKLTRPLHTTQAGMAKSFLVVQTTQLSVRQQLQPEYTIIRMLTTGSHLNKGQYTLPTAPPDTFCVHMDEKVMPSAMRKLNITGKKCKNSAGKVLNKTLNASTRIFTMPLDTQSHQGLLKDFSNTDHVALMTFEEPRGKHLGTMQSSCSYSLRKLCVTLTAKKFGSLYVTL